MLCASPLETALSTPWVVARARAIAGSRTRAAGLSASLRARRRPPRREKLRSATGRGVVQGPRSGVSIRCSGTSVRPETAPALRPPRAAAAGESRGGARGSDTTECRPEVCRSFTVPWRRHETTGKGGSDEARDRVRVHVEPAAGRSAHRWRLSPEPDLCRRHVASRKRSVPARSESDVAVPEHLEAKGPPLALRHPPARPRFALATTSAHGASRCSALRAAVRAAAPRLSVL